MSAVAVRKVEAKDEAKWRHLWQAYCLYYEFPLPEDMIALTWSRLLDPTFPGHGWIAEQNGEAVGFVNALEHSSTWSPGSYVYLEDLFVDQNVRKSGIGTALINAVYAHADLIGSPRVYWHTEADNLNARRLYDKMASDNRFVVYRR